MAPDNQPTGQTYDFSAPNIIDLGETFDPELDEAAYGRLRWGKTARLAVPTVLSLLLISGAASAAPPPITPITRIPVAVGATMTTFGDRVVVLDGRRGKNEITVVDVAGGSRWTSPLDVVGADAVNVIGDTVIVSVRELEPSSVRAEAFDLSTGRHLWSRPDGLADVDPEGHLILESAMPDGSGEMSGVEVRTGADRWRTVVPSECSTYFPDSGAYFPASTGEVSGTTAGLPSSGAGTMAELCTVIAEVNLAYVETAALSVVDLATGLPRATRSVHLPPNNAPRGPGRPFVVFPVPVVTFAAGLILVETDVPAATIAAYRMTDVAMLWSGVPVINAQAVAGCGDVICVQTTTGVEAIDPGTGTLLASGVPPDVPDPDAHQFALVAVGGTVGGSTTIVDTVNDGMLVEPPVQTQGQVWLGVLRPSGIGREWMTTLIQPLPGVGQAGCKQIGAYLVCASGGGQVTLWRLPAS